MMRQDLVFGPIYSRRLGSSLGINLLPTKGKLCNFDCIYCECGWNKDGLDDRKLPTALDFKVALDTKLRQCLRDNINIDSITFAGDGEPTINPYFPKIIDICLELRDRYYPKSKVSVLTNATRIGIEAVYNALRKVDNPILKLDAPTDELVNLINIPQYKYSVDSIVESFMRFEGNFILQTMFLKSKFFCTGSPEVLQPWLNIVRKIRPREIMVYTIDRETPMEGLEKYTVQEMKALVQPLINEGFNVQISG